MNKPMYRVECTEEEAKSIGEHRWAKRSRVRYFLWSMASLLGALVILILAEVYDLSGWLSTPLFLILAGLAFYFPILMLRKMAKAGREFVQSLKEVKSGGS